MANFPVTMTFIITAENEKEAALKVYEAYFTSDGRGELYLQIGSVFKNENSYLIRKDDNGIPTVYDWQEQLDLIVALSKKERGEL